MVGKRRVHWLAIYAGAILLLAPWAERATARVLQAPAVSAVSAAPGPDLRERIALRLEGWNPRLAGVTSRRIADGVLRCQRDHALSPELVLAVIKVESSARPSAHSYKGAIGLMQVMPYMFQALELPGAVSHIESNIEAGCMVLADNIRRLGEERGILSYFWGSRIGGTSYLERVRAVQYELGEGLTERDQGRG
jgi:soluble lytic murein transglycosylase-like protein